MAKGSGGGGRGGGGGRMISRGQLTSSAISTISSSKDSYDITLTRRNSQMTLRTNASISRQRKGTAYGEVPQFGRKPGRMSFIRNSNGLGGDYGTDNMVDFERGIRGLSERGWTVSSVNKVN